MNTFSNHNRDPRWFSISMTVWVYLSLMVLIACEKPPCPEGQVLDGAVPTEEVLKENPYHSFESVCSIPGPYGNLRHGLYRKWYPGGKLLKESYGYEGGIKHGEYTLYYPDGKKKEAGEYRFGMKHGKYEEWHRNGKIHIEGTYADGEKSGDFIIYSNNGMHIKKGPYFSGVKHGKWTNEYTPLKGEVIMLQSFYHYGQLATSL